MWVTWLNAGEVPLSEYLGRLLMRVQTKKLLAIKRGFCTFSTVFNFFEGHPLTLKFSKGHIRILLFRCASNGTGLIPLGPWEGQNTRFSTLFVKHVSGLECTVAVGPANCN